MDNSAYTGWKKWSPSFDEWQTLYNDGKVPFELKENQYLIVKVDGGSSTFYCYENGKLRRFTGGAIKTTKDTTATDEELIQEKRQDKRSNTAKKYSKGKSVVITPRNEEQVCAFDLMRDPTKTVKVLTGT